MCQMLIKKIFLHSDFDKLNGAFINYRFVESATLNACITRKLENQYCKTLDDILRLFFILYSSAGILDLKCSCIRVYLKWLLRRVNDDSWRREF